MNTMYWKISTFAATGLAAFFAVHSYAATPPREKGSGIERGPSAGAASSGPVSWLGGLLASPPPVGVLAKGDPLAKLKAARSIRAECEALQEMGESGDDELTASIVDSASKSGPVRECAIEALGKVKSGAARSWLADLLHDTDAKVRLAAVDALGARENDPEARSILFDAAHEGAPEVRMRALVALGNQHADEAAPLLVDAIRATDRESQADLVSALGETHDPKAVPLLTEVARSGSSEGRQAAIRALGSVGGPEATRTLVDLLQNGGSKETNLAIQALAETNDPGAEKALIEAAGDTRPDVAEAALRSLADRDGDGVREVMSRALGSKDPKLAGGAATYFATHKDEGSVPKLLEIATRGNGASPECRWSGTCPV
jgi:HEAT repeat protein